MDAGPLSVPWSVRIPQPLHDQLVGHLFRDDEDEHGAVLIAGIAATERVVRLLVREVVCARDGIDYVPGERGYRALTPRFVAEVSGRCADENLCYLAIHNHGGRGSVAFSGDDLASHKRGYPALLDVTNGGPVGALVMVEDAVAGDIWMPEGRHEMERYTIVGPTIRHLFHRPPQAVPAVDPRYDRHARMFGDLGQRRLRELKVAVIGLGGGGSLVSQMLAHLGVGWIVGIDHDRVDLTNLPRIVGATQWDALGPLAKSRSPRLRHLGQQLARHKVHVAARVARSAQPRIRYEPIVGDIVNADTARHVVDADAIILATDTMQSRLVFNAIVHQYLIPGFQIGAKVRVDKISRCVDEVFAVARPVLPYPGGGCLQCAGLIPAGRLREEALAPIERAAQRYVDDDEVHEPSVITLNSIGASLAVNDLLLMVTSLLPNHARMRALLYDAQERAVQAMKNSSELACRYCGTTAGSHFARGDRGHLPCREAQQSRHRLID